MLWGVVTKVLLGVGNPQFHQLGPPKQVHLTNRAHVSRFFPKLADPSFIYIYQVIKALTITLGRSSDKRAAFQKAQLCIKPCKPNLHASDCMGTWARVARLLSSPRMLVTGSSSQPCTMQGLFRWSDWKGRKCLSPKWRTLVMWSCTTAQLHQYQTSPQ